MSLVKGLLALMFTFSLGFAQEDADIPPKFKNVISDATYFQLRTDYLNMLRGLPANPALRVAAIQQMQQPRVFAPGIPSVTPAWTAIGPSPIPNGQVTGSLAVSGRTTAVAIDPTNSNIVYVGTAQGGVYRSTDGGTNWTPIFDTASTSAVGALALAPSNHTILYIGTGEANGSGDSYAGVGMYRVDNADTVATLVGPINPIRNYIDGSGNPVSNPAFNGRSISSIAVHSTDPSIVYVGVAGGVIGSGGESPLGGTIPPLGMRGLYRLTNATQAPGSVAVQKVAVATAATGFDLPNTGNRNIDSIAVDPTNPNVMVVWVNGTNTVGDGGVYVSLNATLPNPTFVQTLVTTTTSARAIFASYKQASNPMVIYAATGESFNSAGAGRLRVSTDAGATWSLLAGGNGFCGGQCFYNIGIDVLTGPSTAVTDDVVVLAGNTPGTTSKLFGKSVDGGATFTESSAGLHADTHFIKFDPNNANVIYHGDDGGIFKSINGGTSWSSLNNSQINSVQFSGLAVHPVDPKFSIGGTQDNGTNMRNAAGAWNRVDFGDGGYALIDRNATDTTNVTLYHTYFNATNSLIGFARVLSTTCASDGKWAFKGVYGGSVDPTPNCDSSDTFNGISLSDSVLFYAPMELGPGNPSTVYFGAGALYRSADQGQTMPAVSQRTTSAISSIAVSPLDDNYRLFGRRDGSLWYTTTGATALTQLTGIPAKYVGRVKFDPQNQNTAYVALGGYFGGTSPAQSHIWKVNNISTTPVVSPINGGLPDVPFNAFAVDPANSSNLFAGSDIGIFASFDSGATWAPYGTGLPVVAVFGMEIQPVTRTLRIATHGRGMWEIALPTSLGPNVITFPTPPDTLLSGGPVSLTATASSGLPVSYTSNSTAVCTVSGTSATLISTGVCSITANQAGNASFAAATPVTKTFNVLVNGNVITFPAPPDTLLSGGPVSLTATASSGLPVSYTSNSTAVCTVSGTSATLISTGVCSITASQAGNASFAAATPVTKTFNVLKANQTITWATIPSQTVGVPLTLTATASSNLPVSYTSTTGPVCTVSAGVATFLSAGSCIISATQAGDAFYGPAPILNQTFLVLPSASTISNVQAFAIGTTTELITWTTSQPATSQVNFGLNTTYGSSTPLDNTLVTQHSVTLSNLTTKTTYNFDVVSSGLTSNNGLFTTATPFVGYLAFWGVTNSGVSISWSTDVPANAVVAYGTTPALGQLSPPQPALTSSHGVVLAGLNSGTTYYFMAESTDANGNMGASTIYSFTTTGVPSSPAPVISNVNVTAITSTSATINWTTDVASSSLVNFGTTTAYGSSSPLALPPVTSHTITLNGLTPGTLYNFDVVSQNNSGTATGTSANYTFTTATSTSNPPTISNVVTNNITSTSVTITWNTDQPSWTQVNYGLTTNYNSSSPQDTNLVTSHSVTLTNLTANTTYNFSVKSTNAGGQAAASPNGTFATLPVSTAPPPSVGYLAFWGINNSGVTISWSTDVPADTQIAFGTTPALGQLSPLQTALTASHGVVLTGLNSGTSYYFVAQSKGANGATGYSTTFNFTTTGTASTPPTITNVGVSNITNTSALITWTTDQPSSSMVNYGPASYTSSSPVNPSLVTSHSVALTNLTPGTTYNFDVVSVNSGGATATSPNATFITTGSVPAAPVITNINKTNLTSSSATITWTTDTPASSLVNYGTSTGYGSASTPDPALVTSHSVTLMGLTPSTSYNFDVVSRNATAMTTTSPNNTFTTAATSAAAPQVSFVAFWGMTSSGVTISWSTNVPATTQVMFGTTTSLGQTSPVQSALTTSHGVTLAGLNPGTTYYFMAQSADINSVVGQSTVYSFNTLASAGPVISGVNVTPAPGNTATIKWTTSVAAYSYVQFGAAAGSYGMYSARTGLTTSPVCNPAYVPSGTIHFQLVSVDALGNMTLSPDLTFVEP